MQELLFRSILAWRFPQMTVGLLTQNSDSNTIFRNQLLYINAGGGPTAVPSWEGLGVGSPTELYSTTAKKIGINSDSELKVLKKIKIENLSSSPAETKRDLKF
ncbi:MAG: hypothetical protein HLUCCO16_03790 [Phormidium sp. OSCR]|nr:MAG: hypothetical protein HLUCCO16_03790 [Phormidium sp. OSCR]